MTEPITAQQAYPFPKRAGGHPNFVALLERLYAEHAAKRKADIDAGRPDPGGLTVISWDTNHASPILKEALANPDVAGRTAMSVLAAHRAVYVDEGGSFKSRLFAQYMRGKINDQALPREIAMSYSLAIPELRDRINQSYADVWQAVKQQGVALFYPEPEKATVIEVSFKLSMGGSILGSLQNLGGNACGGVFQEPVRQWLSKEALDRIAVDNERFYAWRSGTDMNQMTAYAANERIAGHNAFVHYGAGHGVLYGMINGEKVGITMLTSQTVPIDLKRPEVHLGDYVYFAAEDKVVKVPTDPK